MGYPQIDKIHLLDIVLQIENLSLILMSVMLDLKIKSILKFIENHKNWVFMNKPEIVENNDIEADFSGRKSYKTYTEMILHCFSISIVLHISSAAPQSHKKNKRFSWAFVDVASDNCIGTFGSLYLIEGNK